MVSDTQIAESYVVPDLKNLQDFELPNGMRVVVVKHGEAPVVQSSIILGRDFTTEPSLLLSFAQNFVRSVGQDPLQIASEVSYYRDEGIPIDPSLGGRPAYALPLFDTLQDNTWGNALRLWIRAPSGNLDGSLWILREELETAKPYINDKIGWLDYQKKAMEGDWASRYWHLEKARSEFLYPGAPWAHEPVKAKSGTLRRLGRATTRLGISFTAPRKNGPSAT